jgi:hypothetical protein
MVNNSNFMKFKPKGNCNVFFSAGNVIFFDYDLQEIEVLRLKIDDIGKVVVENNMTMKISMTQAYYGERQLV